MTKAFHNNVKLSGYSREESTTWKLSRKETVSTLQKDTFNSSSGVEAGKNSFVNVSRIWKIRSDF